MYAQEDSQKGTKPKLYNRLEFILAPENALCKVQDYKSIIKLSYITCTTLLTRALSLVSLNDSSSSSRLRRGYHLPQHWLRTASLWITFHLTIVTTSIKKNNHLYQKSLPVSSKSKRAVICYLHAVQTRSRRRFNLFSYLIRLVLYLASTSLCSTFISM